MNGRKLPVQRRRLLIRCAAVSLSILLVSESTLAQRVARPAMAVLHELPDATTTIVGLVVDRNGRIYAAGTTRAPGFPTTPDAFDRTCGYDGQCGATTNAFHQPQEDAFITRFAPDGTIEYSTFIGGDGRDHLTGFALGQDGSIYLAEEYDGTGMPPPLVRPFTRACGRDDGYVAKLSRTGASLDYASCLSGTEIVSPIGIAVDDSGQAVVAGNAFTPDFPVVNAIQPHGRMPGPDGSRGGGPFVVKLAADGSGVLFSTYVGGSDFDVVTGLALASNGDIAIGGYTQSLDFPLVRPVQRTLNGVSDAFAARLDGAGRTILSSTYLGGKATDELLDVTVDALGNAWYVGNTHSADFPVSGNAVHPRCGNSAPCSLSQPVGVIAAFDPTGRYVYGTFVDTDESWLTRGRLGPQGGLYAIGGAAVFHKVAPLTQQLCPFGPGLCGFLTVLGPDSGFQFASNLPLDGRLPSVSALAVGPQGDMYVAPPTTRGASIVRIDHLPIGLARRR